MQSPDMWVKLIRTLQQERREKTMLKEKIKKDKSKVASLLPSKHPKTEF